MLLKDAGDLRRLFYDEYIFHSSQPFHMLGVLLSDAQSHLAAVGEDGSNDAGFVVAGHDIGGNECLLRHDGGIGEQRVGQAQRDLGHGIGCRRG